MSALMSVGISPEVEDSSIAAGGAAFSTRANRSRLNSMLSGPFSCTTSTSRTADSRSGTSSIRASSSSASYGPPGRVAANWRTVACTVSARSGRGSEIRTRIP